ncbi:MAG: hypothetical protein OEZ39_16425 [Gammaproteobacteria bacterium]|nr:hypothetical protein [Gammaproteobacteria bacterium]MDH5653446.1 hypothetical protein [Gammaproteobacteria bacterium]
MNEERKPFLTLGKSRFSKIANTIVLILLLGFIAVKSGIISPSTTTGFEYTIPADQLQVKTQQELAGKLKTYAVDPVSLNNELQKIGFTLSDFQNNVAMEIVIKNNQSGLQGIIIEFQSRLPADKLKPIYSYIADDIANHVKSR